MPTASEPAGTLTVAAPLLRVAAADVNFPLLNVTEPVGVGVPLPPLTVSFTIRAWAVSTLEAPGATVTVGTASVTVTALAAEPVAVA